MHLHVCTLEQLQYYAEVESGHAAAEQADFRQLQRADTQLYLSTLRTPYEIRDPMEPRIPIEDSIKRIAHLLKLRNKVRERDIAREWRLKPLWAISRKQGMTAKQ